MILDLTPKQAFEYIVMAIKDKNYQGALDIAEDCAAQLEANPKNSVQNPNEEKGKGRV